MASGPNRSNLPALMMAMVIICSYNQPIEYNGSQQKMETHSDSGLAANFDHPHIGVLGIEIEPLTFDASEAYGAEADGDCTPPIVCPEAESPIKEYSLDGTSSVLGPNHGIVKMDGMLYFDANNPRSQLQQYDPTTGSLSEITSIAPTNSLGGQIGKYGGITPLNHIVYFDASHQSSGSELWAYNPQNDSYWMVMDIRPGITASNPGSITGLVAMSGKLWFNADDGVSGNELWTHDPITGITEMVVDLNKGQQGSNPGTFSGLFPVGDRWLFFDADNGASGFEPWVIDSTTGSLSSLGDLNSGNLPSLPGFQLGFQSVGTTVIFDANDGISGTELWGVDIANSESSASLLCDIWVGSSSGQPSTSSGEIAIFSTRAYFSARDQAHGAELWSYDSASDSCDRHTDIRPGSSGSNPGSASSGIHKLGPVIGFSANDGQTGNELWIYSPENNTAWLTVDLTIGSISSYPGQHSGFSVSDEGIVYFTASSDGYGYEPHTLDLSDFSITTIGDIRTGTQSSNPGRNGGYVFMDRDLYFDANDGSGSDLWVVKNATNNSAVSWSVQPQLPFGLEISSVDGTISGVPLQVTPLTTYSVSAVNSTGVMRDIEIEMAILSDFDLDGTPDWVPESMSSFTELTSDLDDDNDGMSDTMEAIAGTSSLDVDTDDDGFCDGINSIQGTCSHGPDPSPLDPEIPIDTDGDMLADEDFDGEGPAVADDDDDNDGYFDLEDDFPLDPTDWLDTDGDTVGDLSDTDDDNDGLPDTEELSIGTDPTLVDSDNDGICDGPYQRDSCSTGPDPYPTNPSLPRDTDGDGLWDDLPEDAADIFVEDQDDDGDGLDDEVETGTGFYISASDRGTDPLNPDSDGDGFCDGSNQVPGVCSRGEDPEPFDPDIPMDRDNDQLADQVDPTWEAFYGDEDADDDGDGYTDSMEYKCDSSALNPNDTPDDIDGDYICDDEDPDMDGDGIFNDEDKYPEDPNDWSDFDNDGVGDNADSDSDGDGLLNEDEHEDCTLNLDCDLDGTPDFDDPFPTDPSEDSDVDGDGIGDNQDPDADNDGVCDGSLGTPGICDAGPDAFPLDPAAYLDTDGDGLTDSLVEGIPSSLIIDLDDDGDGWTDVDEIRCRSDPLDFNDVPSDVDNNKECEAVAARVSETFAVFGALIALMLVVGLFMAPLIRDRLKKRIRSNEDDKQE